MLTRAVSAIFALVPNEPFTCKDCKDTPDMTQHIEELKFTATFIYHSVHE
jgi:hypothetical protein